MAITISRDPPWLAFLASHRYATRGVVVGVGAGHAPRMDRAIKMTAAATAIHPMARAARWAMARAVRTCRSRSAFVAIVVPHPVLWRFRVLISPFGNQVEVVIGGVHHVDSARVGGVGVKNGAAFVLVEHAGSFRA